MSSPVMDHELADDEILALSGRTPGEADGIANALFNALHNYGYNGKLTIIRETREGRQVFLLRYAPGPEHRGAYPQAFETVARILILAMHPSFLHVSPR